VGNFILIRGQLAREEHCTRRFAYFLNPDFIGLTPALWSLCDYRIPAS
jgi:hypothetical protein